MLILNYSSSNLYRPSGDRSVEAESRLENDRGRIEMASSRGEGIISSGGNDDSTRSVAFWNGDKPASTGEEI